MLAMLPRIADELVVQNNLFKMQVMDDQHFYFRSALMFIRAIKISPASRAKEK